MLPIYKVCHEYMRMRSYSDDTVRDHPKFGLRSTIVTLMCPVQAGWTSCTGQRTSRNTHSECFSGRIPYSSVQRRS